MLAEPRKRVRYGLNPNGIQSSENSVDDKGKKMLSQMGWSEGTGLGAQGQGITAPIKASLKNNLQGVGYTQLSGGELLDARMVPFNNLLDRLKQCQVEQTGISNTQSSTESEDSAEESVPRKQEKSYLRVRHHRRITVKDLSKRSEAEMKCIIGGAVVSKSNQIKNDGDRDIVSSATEETSASPTVGEVEECAEENQSGVMTHVNSMNMMDYFKSKLAARSIALSQKSETVVDNEKKEDGHEDNSSICRSSAENESTNPNDALIKSKSGRKRKNMEDDVIEEYYCGATSDVAISNEFSETGLQNDVRIKRKKKHPEKGADNVITSPISLSSQSDEDLHVSKDSIKKKKKRTKNDVEDTEFETASLICTQNQECEDQDEVKKKKKRRKEKSMTDMNDQRIESCTEVTSAVVTNDPEIEIDDTVENITKKRHKERKSEEPTDDSTKSCFDDPNVISQDNYPHQTKDLKEQDETSQLNESCSGKHDCEESIESCDIIESRQIFSSYYIRSIPGYRFY